MLPFELTKDTPYLALSGELWSVFYEYFNRNWSCYKGFPLYIHLRSGHCPIRWGWQKNGMQTKPGKFNFMLFSPMPKEQQVVQLCDGTSLMSEIEWLSWLGMMSDDVQ